MSKQTYFLDSFSIKELENHLIKKLGFRITSKSECAKLSELIFEAGLPLISESTLYRIFIQYNKHKPYKNTLNILCEFIGFSDWDSFFSSTKKTQTFQYQNGIIEREVIESNLIFQCIETEAFAALDNFFLKLNDGEVLAKEMVVLTIYDSLLCGTKNKVFFKKFANHEFVRNQFFENGFDPTFRIPNYALGFEYYLNEVKFDYDIKHLQDFIFAKAVLFRHYYLKKDFEKAIALGKEIYEIKTISEKDISKVHLFPRIRFIAYKLWYLSLCNEKDLALNNYIEEILSYSLAIHDALNLNDKRIVFYTIGEVFTSLGVSSKFQNQLKELYYNEFTYLPAQVIRKPLKLMLPYIEPNGLLQQRPIVM